MSGIGRLLFFRPDPKALRGHFIGQGQQLGMRLDQRGARPLITAIFQGPSPDLGPLVFWDGVNPVLARLTAGQDPGGVEWALARRLGREINQDREKPVRGPGRGNQYPLFLSTTFTSGSPLE